MEPKFTRTKVQWHPVCLSFCLFLLTSISSEIKAQCSYNSADAGIQETISIGDQLPAATPIFQTSYQEVCDAYYDRADPQLDSSSVEGPDWMFDIDIPPGKRTACDAEITVCRRGDFGGSGLNPLNEPVIVLINGIPVDTIWNDPATGDGCQPPSPACDCDPVPICNTTRFNAAEINAFASGGNIMVELRTLGGTCGNQPKETDRVCINFAGQFDGDYNDDGILDGNCVELRNFQWDVAPDISISCPGDITVQACDEDIEGQFNFWISQFTSSGGCPPLQTSEPPFPPTLCEGGTVTYDYIVSDNAGRMVSCSASFTVLAPTPLTATCPPTENIPACMDSLTIEQTYAVWRGLFTDGGGCNRQVNTVFPPNASNIVYGGTIMIDHEVVSDCDTIRCQSSFVVPDYEELMVSCPNEEEFLQCADQNQVDIAFFNWIAGFTVSGGCEPYEEPALPANPPSVCDGDTIDIFYEVTDALGFTKSCTSSFKVEAPDPLNVSGPSNRSFEACADQSVINSEFSAWLDSFTYMGGCASYNETPKNVTAPSVCAGGTVSFVYTVMDGCGSQGTAQATFMVTGPAPVDVTGPISVTYSACAFPDQTALNQVYQDWKNQFMDNEIGCGPAGGFVQDLSAPTRCSGGTVTLEWIADDGCTFDNAMASFTINAANQVQVSCPNNVEILSCEASSQEDINSQFSTWLASFSVSESGCGVSSSDLSGYSAPDICTGGTVFISYGISDGCTSDNCVRSFVVEPTLPLEVSCPEDMIETTCDDPTTSFRDWLSEFMVTGGCISNTIEYHVDYGDGITTYSSIDDIPSISTCGMVTVEVVVTGDEGGCEAFSTSCSATFTLEPEAVEAICPPPLDLPYCVDDYTSKFLAWAQGFNVNGGCGTLEITYEVQIDDAIYLYRDIKDAVDLIPVCGGEMNIKLIVKDELGCSDSECMTAFRIAEEEEELYLKCPPPVELPPCEYDIPRFKQWIKGFEWGGGCNLEIICCIRYDDGPVIVVTTFDNVPAPNQCGEKLTVTIKISSECHPPITCESSFEIKKSDPLTVSCPGDLVVQACLSEEEMELAYQDWLNAFDHSGGCLVEAGFTGGVPDIPHYCGGSVTATYRAKDGLGCNADALCSASFTVEEVQELIVSCPSDFLIEECVSQEEIDASYANWLEQFSYEGSCAKVGDFVGGVPPAPRVCGGSVEVTYKIPNTRSCFVFQTCTRSFTVVGSDGSEQIIGDVDDKELGCNKPYPDTSSVTGIDRCGKPFSLSLTEELSFDNSTCLETLIRTWTADSGCGDAFSVSQTLTRRVDLEGPELGLVLDEEITVNCGEVPAPQMFLPIDNCGLAEFGVKDDTIRDNDIECPVVFRIMRTYYAIDDCGNETSTTQAIDVVNEGGPVFINPPADICDDPISFTEYILMEKGPLEVMNMCTGEVGLSEDPYISYDCMTNIYTFKWEAMDECGNQSSYTQMICIETIPPSCDLMLVNEEPCGGITRYTLQISGSLPPYTIQWEILEGDWEIAEGANRAAVFFQTTASEAVVQATIVDANGCVSVCTQRLSCTVGAACTFTEAFYGEDSTELCEGASTGEVLMSILDEGPITIGLPGASFTIQSGDEGCVMELLGQSEAAIPSALTGNGNCTDINVELSDGSSTNPLFNQLLALALNLVYDDGLSFWSIENKCVKTLVADSCKVGPMDEGIPGTVDSFCFSQVMLDRMGAGFSVQDLRAVADSALAGFDMGVDLSEIVRALQFVNEAFSGCRIVEEFGDFPDISSLTNEVMEEKNWSGQRKSMLKDMKSSLNSMIIRPNPATTQLRVQLYSKKAESGFLVIRDQNGKNQIRKDVRLQQGENQFNMLIDNLNNGIYLIQYVNESRYDIQKFMKMH